MKDRTYYWLIGHPTSIGDVLRSHDMTLWDKIRWWIIKHC